MIHIYDIYIYIYIYTYVESSSKRSTANLRTKILGFRGFDSSIILNLKGWNSHVHRKYPRNSESSRS